MNTSRTSRHVHLSLALVLALAAVLAALLSTSADAHAQPAGPYNHICHADGTGSWEYDQVSGGEEVWLGHYQLFIHSSDIIPPLEFLGIDLQQNWDADHWSTWTNNCVKLIEPAITHVDPVQPTFIEATCESGPSASLPEPPGLVTYSWDVAPAPGVTVNFFATLAPHDYLKWGNIGLWIPTSDPRVLTQSYMFVAPDCPTPTSTDTPSATGTPTATETVSPTETSIAMPVSTQQPVSLNPPSQNPPAVTGLPDTGAGNEASSIAITLILATFGCVVLGGITKVHRDRKCV